MNIYKLNYTDKETAIADLIAKGVYNEDLEYINGTQAVVDIGKIVKVEGTYDENGDVITEPIYHDGYAYDLMTTDTIDFGSADITLLVKTPMHGFAGYSNTKEDE